jgi:hypothetical protein
MDNPEINPVRTIGKASAEAQALIKFLETAEVNQIVTHQEMMEASKSTRHSLTWHLATARRNLLKKNIVFGTVIGIGIKRLPNDEIPDDAGDKLKRSRRMAKKGLSIMGCANISELSNEQKMKAITTRTILGFMAVAGSRKILNLTEQAVRTSNGEMKIGSIETLFKKQN